MDREKITRNVEIAQEISADFPQQESQVFTAVLTALLLGGRTQADAPLTQQPLEERPLTAAEFFAQLRPAQDVDKALSAAYFTDVFRNRSEFSAEELRQVLADAKVSPPSNVSLAVLRNAQRGLMAQKEKHGKRITWLITQSGIEKVKEMSRSATAGNG